MFARGAANTQSETHEKRMTHKHNVSHTPESGRQRQADRWSLSNSQKTKNMVAFLRTLTKHAHAHTHTH